MTTGSLYLDSIKVGAIRGWIEERIPASLTGAQAALESGWGTSSLARAPYNNQFGIKASSDWTGRVVNMPTKEYLNGSWVAVNADFRAYDDINDSVADHAKFFTSTEWRKSNYAAVIGETDYKKACYAVKAAGYATDPDYASKLINIIEKYKLYEWDIEAQSGTVPTVSDDVEVVSNLQPKSKIVGGDLSDAGRAFGKKTGVSVIGDSLGVGTEPHLVKLIPNSNYDVKGSRQITHTDSTLNGTIALQNMKNAGNLKQNVVVILGTNRGLTASEIDNFMNICGPERKVLWVETASAVKHNLSANEEMRKAATRHKNAFVLGWYDMVGGLRKEYYGSDDIHMTYMGYFNHAKAIVQGVYEMSTGDFDSSVAQTTTMQFEGIKGFKLSEDGKLEYTDENKVKQVIQTEFKGLSTDGKTNYIYNVSANNEFNPQTGATEADWLEGRFESSDLKGLDLFMAACRDMMNRGEPEATYRVVLSELPKGIEIGAEGTIVDTASNPPRYITARVSEITTSQTNPEYNEVVITNVVEVKPFEKPTTLLIQEELRKNRDKLNTDYKERILESDLNSMGGLVLATEDSETTLIADVEVDGEDVTEHYSDFRWERQSNNAESDKQYNEVLSKTENGMALNVSDKDIEGEDSMFICRIYDDAGNLVRTIMKKMVSQVKIKKEIDTVLDRFDTERTETEQAINESLESAKAEAERMVDEQTRAFDAKFGDIEDSVDTFNQSVSDADAKAEAIKQGLGLADINLTNQQITDQIRQDFDSLKSTANTANQAITDLDNEYRTFLTDQFNPAFTTATNALSLAEQNKGLFYSANLIDEVTGLSNVYTKAEIDGTNGYVTKATFNANAESLSSEFERIEGVALASGANINLLITRNQKINTWLDANPSERTYPTPNVTTNLIATSPDLISVTPGEKITLSKTTTPLDNYFRIDYLDANKKYVNRYTQNANVATITIPENVAYLWVSYPMDSYPKIERGEVKTQWTLAPQDQVNQSTVNYLTSKIEQTPGLISEALTAYTPTDNLDNTVASYLTNTTTKTAGAIATKLSDYQTTSGLDGSVASILDNTESQTAGKINSKLTDIQAQIPTEFGGRNLLRGTADFDTYFWRNVSTVMPSTRDSRYKQVRVDGDFTVAPITTMATQGWNFEIGQEYTISVWAKSEELGNKLGVTAQSTPYFEPQVVTLSKWSRYTWTFTATMSNLTNFRFETRNGERVWITQPQIEKGSIPTDWTRAVEDLATVVQTNEIERTANYTKSAITNVTKDGLVTGSTVNQTKDGITERVARLDTNGNVTYANRDVKLDSIVSTVANDKYISNIIQASDLVQSTIRENTNVDLLAKAASGTGMTTDPNFNKGINGLTVYDNGNTNTISIYRNLTNDPNLPGGKGHRLDIYHASSTATSPNRGGVALPTQSWANGVVVVRFTANLEIGKSFVYAQNSIGTGSTHGWLTSNKGTGKWEQYAYYYRFGTTGTFDTFGFLSVNATSAAFTWRLADFDIINLGMSSQSQITQLSNSWALTLKSGNDIKTAINATTDGIRLKGSLITLDGLVNMTSSFIVPEGNIGNLSASKIKSGTIDTARLDAKSIVTNGLQANVVKSTHILADNALFTKLFTNDLATQKLATKQAWIKSSMIGDAQIGTAQIGQIDAGTGKIVNIDAQYITANHAKLVSAGFKGLNSNMYVDGGAIRIQNTAGDFATMNAIPEFRSQDSLGTAAIMGKGRSQYYSGNQSRFYIGSSLNGDEYNGKVVHGVHISKNQTWGIYRQSDAFGGTPAQYFKTPTGWGAVNVVEELMRTGKVVNNFTQASALIRSLNGWGNSWPVLQPGDMVMYKAAVPGNSSGIERIWTMGTSSNGTTRTYSHVHHVFEGGTTGVSDERLKHDIKPTDIKALEHISKLAFKQFKWNRNDELEPLGLIAQESGILRVPDEEMEGIDIQRAMMLALKGIQELSQKVQEMGA